MSQDDQPADQPENDDLMSHFPDGEQVAPPQQDAATGSPQDASPVFTTPISAGEQPTNPALSALDATALNGMQPLGGRLSARRLRRQRMGITGAAALLLVVCVAIAGGGSLLLASLHPAQSVIHLSLIHI